MERSPADVLRLAVAADALLLLTLDQLAVRRHARRVRVRPAPRARRRCPTGSSGVSRPPAESLAVVVLVGGLVVTVVRTGWRMLGTVAARGRASPWCLVVLLADFPDIDEGDVAAELRDRARAAHRAGLPDGRGHRGAGRRPHRQRRRG